MSRSTLSAIDEKWVADECVSFVLFIFFFQAEDGIRDLTVTGVQTCALPISDNGCHDLGRCRDRDHRWRGLSDHGDHRLVDGAADARRARPDRITVPRLRAV